LNVRKAFDILNLLSTLTAFNEGEAEIRGSLGFIHFMNRLWKASGSVSDGAEAVFLTMT
jgi:hypothetical protein